MKRIEQIRKNIESRVNAIQEELYFSEGCLWCYRKRMPGSKFCCEEHKHKYNYLNNKKEE